MANGRIRARTLMVYFFALVTAFLFVSPVIWLVSASLQKESDLLAVPPRFIPENPSGESYLKLLASEYYEKTKASDSGVRSYSVPNQAKLYPGALLNSFVVSASTTLICLLIGSMTAYSITRLKFRGRSTIFFGILASRMVPSLALVIPFFMIARGLGMIDRKIWLILVYSSFTLPYVVWMLKGFFDAVPRDLEEAARIDGCSRVSTIWRIIYPMIGPVQGVSVLADAGSSGHVTFPGFRKYIIDTKPYGIFAFLNFGSIGLIRTNVIGDFETDDCIQSDETLRCIEANRDVIRGVKLRACRVTLKGRGIEIVHRASAAAREADLPLMVHIGEPGPPLGEILNSLRAGDIVTHCFHGKPGCIIGDNGRIIPEAYAARERGVLFDIGHGGASFDIHVGRRAVLDEGFRPHLISTDLHSHNINGPVHSLALTMSKMLACGLDEEEILEGVTAAPARSLGIEDYQSGILGREARFTLFETVENEKTFFDAGGNGIQPSRLFRPRFTILGSKVISCG